MPRNRHERWRPGPLDRPLAPEANRPLAEELTAIMSGRAPAPTPLERRSRVVLAIGHTRVIVTVTLLAAVVASAAALVAGVSWATVPLVVGGLLLIVALVVDRPAA